MWISVMLVCHTSVVEWSADTQACDATVLPWQQTHCDSIGSWTVELRGRNLAFHAMTMINACANLVEIAFAHSTMAKEGAAAVETTWLSRCPRPVKIVMDQGPEFG